MNSPLTQPTKFFVGDLVRSKIDCHPVTIGMEGTITWIDGTCALVSFEVGPTQTQALSLYLHEIEHTQKTIMFGGIPIVASKTLKDKDWVTVTSGVQPGKTTQVDSQKEIWKSEGRCEQCGTLRPMSIHGLLDCPNHPTIVTE